MHTGFWWKNLNVRDHLEGLALEGGGGNIKTDLQEMVWGNMDWIDVAQDMDNWRALGKVLWNFELCKMQGMSWLAPEQVLCTMELVS